MPLRLQPQFRSPTSGLPHRPQRQLRARVTPAPDQPWQQNGAIGTPISRQIQATDSAPGQTPPFAATGLPAGLMSNPSTGLINGTPTKRGNFTVTVAATDTTHASGSATLTRKGNEQRGTRPDGGGEGASVWPGGARSGRCNGGWKTRPAG